MGRGLHGEKTRYKKDYTETGKGTHMEKGQIRTGNYSTRKEDYKKKRLSKKMTIQTEDYMEKEHI